MYILSRFSRPEAFQSRIGVKHFAQFTKRKPIGGEIAVVLGKLLINTYVLLSGTRGCDAWLPPPSMFPGPNKRATNNTYLVDGDTAGGQTQCVGGETSRRFGTIAGAVWHKPSTRKWDMPCCVPQSHGGFLGTLHLIGHQVISEAMTVHMAYDGAYMCMQISWGVRQDPANDGAEGMA